MEERFAAHEEDEQHAQEAEKQQVCACQIDVSLYACMLLIRTEELLFYMFVDSCMCVCVYMYVCTGGTRVAGVCHVD
jgi:hypothetical protein